MNAENAILRNVTREYHLGLHCHLVSITDNADTLWNAAGSRPEILRSPSKQSAAASDDYHSVSDYASSSSDDRTTAVRWATPPSQAHSQSQLQSQSRSPELFVDTTRASPTPPGRSARRDRVGGAPTSAIAEVDEGGPSSLPAAQARTRSRTATDNDVSPPTPGVDDTPYIRYAIDQITRNDVDDPRVRRPDTASSLSTYPVEHIVPAERYEPLPPRKEEEKQPRREVVKPARLSCKHLQLSII